MEKSRRAVETAAVSQGPGERRVEGASLYSPWPASLLAFWSFLGSALGYSQLISSCLSAGALLAEEVRGSETARQAARQRTEANPASIFPDSEELAAAACLPLSGWALWAQSPPLWNSLAPSAEWESHDPPQLQTEDRPRK